MRTLHTLLYSLSFLLLCANANAWQVDLADDGRGQFNQIVVSSDRDVRNQDIYLVWVDLDAGNNELVISSWTADNGWQRGALERILPQALDLPPFEELPLAINNETCPAEHRCFLAMLAVPTGENPLEALRWEAASLLPLTRAAGRERLPGQRFFLANDGTSRFADGPSGVNAVDGAPVSAPTLAVDELTPPTENADANADASQAVTEKPDIFRLNGTELLYANGQAKRFQIIDVSDPNRPVLQASVKRSPSFCKIAMPIASNRHPTSKSSNMIPRGPACC
ncbi:MAG: hypothetical protein AAF512_11300, partial [Pseudomonadota bacterium]